MPSKTSSRTQRPAPRAQPALPDMMRAPNTIEGARVAIQQAGIDGFKLPMRFAFKAARRSASTLQARVTGTVSLEAVRKGIDMSRIMRSFYEHEADVCSPELLARILHKYRRAHEALEARLRVAFSFPALQRSLRSGLDGWQYYDAAYEASIAPTAFMERGDLSPLLTAELVTPPSAPRSCVAGEPTSRLVKSGDKSPHSIKHSIKTIPAVIRRFVEIDFVYSSACPCSAALAEHARETRGVYAVGHSQRSKARVRVEVAQGKRLDADALREHCAAALRTETQVLVKREDEQAFAELNGTHLKFVEDAARLIYARLDADARVSDFRVVCAHYESLHSHDAVSVLCKGARGGMSADVLDFRGM